MGVRKARRREEGRHWEPKAEQGPSDAQAAKSGRAARESDTPTQGGINARKPKQALYDDAKQAGIEGRSNMTKDELVDALKRDSRRRTEKARK